MKAIALAVFLTASFGATGGEPADNSLRTFANQLTAALQRDDWNAFRKLATPYFAIEEHWRAYDMYLKDERKGRDGNLGYHADKLIEYRTVIQNTASVPANHRKLFKGFCKMVRNSRNYSSASWVWPEVQGDYGKYTFIDSYPVSTPLIYGKLASNLDFVVEVVRTDNGWRARRLMICGH